MPRHCSAVGCKSRDTKEVRKFGITFHRLPKKGNPRRTSWIINSCRKGPGGKGQWEPQSHFIYFCSKHFTPDSFELSGVSGYRRLKDDAIPTVFEIQPHERGTARRGTAKTRGRPNVDKHISVKNSSKDSESQETFNSERMTQKVSDDADDKSSEQGKGGENQEQPPPQPSSKAAHTVDDPPDPSFPQPSPHPTSPSCYMRRLPPPPGFYLPKEHNYAQLCPLVWRKRYDKAIDSLEKTLQLLSAARRRENRLRNALFRLRENRLKSTLFRTRDGVNRKEGKGGRFSSWAAQKRQATKGKGDGSLEGLEENPNEGAAVAIAHLNEDWNSQVQTRAKVLLEDEEGFCFYCGRDNEGNKVIGYNEPTLGSAEVQGFLVSCRPKGLKEVQKVQVPTVLRGQWSETNTVQPVEQQSYYLYYCESDENKDTMQVVTMEMQPQKLNTEDEAFRYIQDHAGTIQQLAVLHPQTEMPMHTVPGPVQHSATSASFQLQVLQPHHKLLLPEIDAKEKSESEIDQSREPQFYWVQERTDDHVLLTSVPVETSKRSKVENVGAENEIVQHQSVLETFQLRVTEERDSLPIKCDSLTTMGWGNSQVTHQPNLKPKVVGDVVRERLKEHLEGFQLQLSSEFID